MNGESQLRDLEVWQPEDDCTGGGIEDDMNSNSWTPEEMFAKVVADNSIFANIAIYRWAVTNMFEENTTFTFLGNFLYSTSMNFQEQ